jgi:endogenous inhibitor of DNA gyrase (YacG/DUF329 family)
LHADGPTSIVGVAVERNRTTVRCPSCRAPVQWAGNPYRPFCSERCRIVDLGNWAAERYRVPSECADGIDNEDEPSDKPVH